MSQKVGVIVRQRRRGPRRAPAVRGPGPGRRAAPGPARAAPRRASRPRRPAVAPLDPAGTALEGEPGVGVDGERGVVRLELAEVGLDLDDPTARPERVVVAGQLAEAAADDEQHVGVLEQLGGVPVLEPGLQRQRVLPRERALRAEGRRDRRAQRLGELQQRRLGAGPDDPAAGQDRPDARRRPAAGPPRRAARRAAAGTRGAHGQVGRPAGARPSPSSTSWGISTQVGPYGGVSAVSHASARAPGMLAGLGHDARRTSRRRATLARWSRSSCR